MLKLWFFTREFRVDLAVDKIEFVWTLSGILSESVVLVFDLLVADLGADVSGLDDTNDADEAPVRVFLLAWLESKAFDVVIDELDLVMWELAAAVSDLVWRWSTFLSISISVLASFETFFGKTNFLFKLNSQVVFHYIFL